MPKVKTPNSRYLRGVDPLKSAMEEKKKVCEIQQLNKINDFLTRLERILEMKNVRPEDQSNDSYYFYDILIEREEKAAREAKGELKAEAEGELEVEEAKSEAEIGHIVCGLSDINKQEVDKIDRYFRSRATYHENRESEDIPALYVSWIGITEGSQGKGYGALLFIYGLLMSIKKNIGILIYFLMDCSDNSKSLKRNLYSIFAFNMYTVLEGDDPHDEDGPLFKEYFEEAIKRIDLEEEMRRSHPEAFANLPSLSQSSSQDSNYSGNSSMSSQSSDGSDYDQSELDQLTREAVDTSIANVTEIFGKIDVFLDKVEEKLRGTLRSAASMAMSLEEGKGGRKTLKKGKRRGKHTLKKGGKRKGGKGTRGQQTLKKGGQRKRRTNRNRMKKC